jgi:hypothetical protein
MADLRIGLTKEENERLEIPSIVAWDDKTVYPVVVSVFHNLHVSRSLSSALLGCKCGTD